MKGKDRMTEKRLESAEFVLPGHPDKLCDAALDKFIGRCAPQDQCGLEMACVFDRVFITGRIAWYHGEDRPAGRAPEFDETRDTPSILAALEDAVRQTYREAGYGVDAAGHRWDPLPENLRIDTALCLGGFAPEEWENRPYADDQAICIGYACQGPETGYLPPAHWLARRIGRQIYRLREQKGAGQAGPDGKVLVTVERKGQEWQPVEVSVSLHHHQDSDWLFLRRLVEQAVAEACRGKAQPRIVLNGAGMFLAGGPMGDNGLSGKKLVVDAYGPTVPIGGGAWSGKDFMKVDRIGGQLARELALRILQEKGCSECQVTLRYYPGDSEPRIVAVLLDSKQVNFLGIKSLNDIEMGTMSLWRRYRLQLPLNRTLNLEELARWGHQREGMPWEKR